MILIALLQALCGIFLLFVKTIFTVGLALVGIVLLMAIICEVMK